MSAIDDLRYSARSLRKSPVAAGTCILVLALGIAVNTAAFSVVNTLVRRPLPFEQSDRLAVAGQRDVKSGAPSSVSLADFYRWREYNAGFEEIGAAEPRSFNVGGATEPESVPGAYVTAGFIRALRLRPVVGRSLMDDDEKPGAPPVVLLAHGYWERRFDLDPAVVGRDIIIDGERATVAGVLPRINRSYYASYSIWRPLTASAAGAESGLKSVQVIGRLQTGVGFAHAESALAALAQQEPAGSGARPFVQPMADIMKHVIPAYAMLLTVVLLLLALVCANIATLQLARAAGRQKEIAVRLALGAGRFRVIRQLLAEGLLMAGAGGALGFAIAVCVRRILVARVPELAELSLDAPAVAFTAFVSAGAGMLFGLSPALSVSNPDLHGTLKSTGRMGNRAAGKRVRGVLVVSEMAVAIMLLACVGVVAHGFMNLRRADVGFNKANLLTMRVTAPGAQYTTPERRAAFVRQALERVRNAGGVESAAAASVLPLSGGAGSLQVEVEGADGGVQHIRGQYNAVTPGYFQVAGIPLRQGSAFEETDASGPLAVIVNARAAALLWPGADPLGKRIRVNGGAWRTVAAVAGNVRQDLFQPASPEFYVPHAQDAAAAMSIVARTRPAAASVAAAARAAIRAFEHDAQIGPPATMDEIVAGYFPGSILAGLGAFCAAALFVASLGLYGVVSYLAGLRAHEFGVRIALGATPGSLLRLVLAHSFKLAGTGAAIGLVGAFAAARVIAGAIPEVSPFDPAAFGAAAALLAGTALIASVGPARRAAAADPASALRLD